MEFLYDADSLERRKCTKGVERKWILKNVSMTEKEIAIPFMQPLRQVKYASREFNKARRRLQLQPEAYAEFYKQFEPQEVLNIAENTQEKVNICTDNGGGNRRFNSKNFVTERKEKYTNISSQNVSWWSARFKDLEKKHLEQRLQAVEIIQSPSRLERRKLLTKLHYEHRTGVKLQSHGNNKLKWDSSAIQTEIIGPTSLKLVSTITSSENNSVTLHLKKLKDQAQKQRRMEQQLLQYLENDLMQQEEAEQKLVQGSMIATEDFLDFRVYMQFQALFGALPDWLADPYVYGSDGIIGRLPGRRYHRIIIRAAKSITSWWKFWWPKRKERLLKSAHTLQRIYRGHHERLYIKVRKDQFAYVEKCVRKIRFRTIYSVWTTWLFYTLRNRQVKDKIKLALRSIKQKVFSHLRDIAKTTRYEREAKLQIALAKLRYNSIVQIVSRWKYFAERSIKMKSIYLKSIMSVKVGSFHNWRSYSGRVKHERKQYSRDFVHRISVAASQKVIKNIVLNKAALKVQQTIQQIAFMTVQQKRKKFEQQRIQTRLELKKRVKRLRKFRIAHENLLAQDEKLRMETEIKFVNEEMVKIKSYFSQQFHQEYLSYRLNTFARKTRLRGWEPVFLEAYRRMTKMALKDMTKGSKPSIFYRLNPLKRLKLQKQARHHAAKMLLNNTLTFAQFGTTLLARSQWNPNFSTCVLPDNRVFYLVSEYINCMELKYENSFNLATLLLPEEAQTHCDWHHSSNPLSKSVIQLHIGLSSPKGKILLKHILKIHGDIPDQVISYVNAWTCLQKAKISGSSQTEVLVEVVKEMIQISSWWSDMMKAIIGNVIKIHRENIPESSSTKPNHFGRYTWLLHLMLLESEYALLLLLHEKLNDVLCRKIFEAQSRYDAACLGKNISAARVLQKYARGFLASSLIRRLRETKLMEIEDNISSQSRRKLLRTWVRKLTPKVIAGYVKVAFREIEIHREEKRILNWERKKERTAKIIQRAWKRHLKKPANNKHSRQRSIWYGDDETFSLRKSLFLTRESYHSSIFS